MDVCADAYQLSRLGREELLRRSDEFAVWACLFEKLADHQVDEEGRRCLEEQVVVSLKRVEHPLAGALSAGDVEELVVTHAQARHPAVEDAIDPALVVVLYDARETHVRRAKATVSRAIQVIRRDDCSLPVSRVEDDGVGADGVECVLGVDALVRTHLLRGRNGEGGRGGSELRRVSLVFIVIIVVAAVLTLRSSLTIMRASSFTYVNASLDVSQRNFSLMMCATWFASSGTRPVSALPPFVPSTSLSCVVVRPAALSSWMTMMMRSSLQALSLR